MRNVTQSTITDAVIKTLEHTENPRLKTVMTSLIRHLHDFAREVKLTEGEWITAIDFLAQVGAKTTPERNEFILLSDTLGLSSLVDMLNNQKSAGATDSSVLGPFYIDGARMQSLNVGDTMIGDNPGEPVLVTGRVASPDGAPIAGARLEVWQNAANGMYESEDPNQAEGNLRCRMITNADGGYRFHTTKPVAYTVPEDGPVGDLLKAVNRHAWRPAHIHFKVSAPNYQPLITELYVAEDPYIDQDAVFGVRETLVVPFRRLETEESASAYHVKPGYSLVEYSFGLEPVS